MIRETVKEQQKQVGPACQDCGRPVKVWVMKGYREGKPVMGQFCMDCADRQNWGLTTDRPGQETGRLGAGSLFIFLGLSVGILGIMGDYLGIRGFNGLAWHQQIGLTLGALLVVIGALFRVDPLVVIGALGFGFSVFSDTFGLTGDKGFGWKQEFAVVAGLVMILIGFVLRRSFVRLKRELA